MAGAARGDSSRGPASGAPLKTAELAADWAKHVTTLAIGTLVLSATFISDVLGNDAHIDSQWALLVAWVLLVATAVCGVLAQGALIYQLSLNNGEEKVTRARSVQIWFGGELVLFLLGIVFFTAYTALNL